MNTFGKSYSIDIYEFILFSTKLSDTSSLQSFCVSVFKSKRNVIVHCSFFCSILNNLSVIKLNNNY